MCELIFPWQKWQKIWISLAKDIEPDFVSETKIRFSRFRLTSLVQWPQALWPKTYSRSLYRNHQRAGYIHWEASTPTVQLVFPTLQNEYGTKNCSHWMLHVWSKAEQMRSIHSFILAISIAPLQVLYHSEALPTTARIPYRSFTPKHTGNCR